MMTLMKVLYDRGKLNAAQEQFWLENRPEFELYDIQDDPHEIHNLADDPAFASVKQNLLEKLDRWLVEYDQNEYPENPKAVQEQMQLMQENYVNRMTARGLDPNISDQQYLDWWESHLLDQQSSSISQ